MRFLALADTHGDFAMLESIAARVRASHPGLRAVLHGGDLGIFDRRSPERIPAREKILIERHGDPVDQFQAYLDGIRPLPLPVLAVPGNHEDFLLWEDVARSSPVPGLRLLEPDAAARFEEDGDRIVVAGLGRILPAGLSEKRRAEAKFIPPAHLEDIRRTGRAERVDVLLLHETPFLKPPAGRRFGNIALTGIVRDLRPRVVLAGHMHFEYRARLEDSDIYGLGYGRRGRYAVLEIDARGSALTFFSLDGDPPAPVEAIPGDEAEYRAFYPELPPALLTASEIRGRLGLDGRGWPANRVESLMGSVIRALERAVKENRVATRDEAWTLIEQILIRKGIGPAPGA